MENLQIKSLIIILIIPFFLSSCGTEIKTSEYKSPEIKNKDFDEKSNIIGEFTDIPIPSNSVIDLEKSFILGKGNTWMGRLSLIHKSNIDELYDFFINEMKKFSYKEKSSIRSNENILIFENKIKTVFIKISELKFRKSYIEITSTPVN